MNNKIFSKKTSVREIEGSSNTSQLKNIIDNNNDTCWFSTHGNSQWISVYLDKCRIKKLSLTFQNGFQCKDLVYKYNGKEGAQTVGGCQNKVEIDICEEIEVVEIRFLSSYDAYGRICIYDLELE